MDNQALSQKLSTLEKQVKTLLQAYQKERELSAKKQSENDQLKAEVEGLRGQLADFQNQYKITKIVSNTTVEKEESAELKHKLNEYIKEIDRCIAHLSE